MGDARIEITGPASSGRKPRRSSHSRMQPKATRIGIVPRFRRIRVATRGLIAAPWTPLASLCCRGEVGTGPVVENSCSGAATMKHRLEKDADCELTSPRLHSRLRSLAGRLQGTWCRENRYAGPSSAMSWFGLGSPLLVGLPQRWQDVAEVLDQ